MAKQFTEEHEVTFYECDTTGKLTLPMLLNVVIKTSESQSEAVGRSSAYVMDRGLTWVITKHEITIQQLPTSEDIVKVTTQATTYNKYFCYRNFWIHDQNGNELVAIQSTFVLMDLASRKMTSVPSDVIAPFDCQKITKIQRGEKIAVFSAEHTREYRVRYSDIDANQHVNNSRYLDWMVDCLDIDFLKKHQAKRVVIRFDKEVEYGATIQSHWTLVEESNNPELSFSSYHEVSVGEKTCAEARIDWQALN